MPQDLEAHARQSGVEIDAQEKITATRGVEDMLGDLSGTTQPSDDNVHNLKNCLKVLSNRLNLQRLRVDIDPHYI